MVYINDIIRRIFQFFLFLTIVTALTSAAGQGSEHSKWKRARPALCKSDPSDDHSHTT